MSYPEQARNMIEDWKNVRGDESREENILVCIVDSDLELLAQILDIASKNENGGS